MQNIQGALFLLRIGLGWIFFYAGLSKILDPHWSAVGLLNGAKTWPEVFHWFASPAVLPTINFVNEWGLFLLGVSLLFGVCVRLSVPFGILLMALYYIPQLDFPIASKNYFLIDHHIIFIVGLFILFRVGAGMYFGVDGWIAKQAVISKHPLARRLFH